tara:strand:- start:1 stop:108 length:108 start_codon:yes stop_codon:yes gene_type:complete
MEQKAFGSTATPLQASAPSLYAAMARARAIGDPPP